MKCIHCGAECMVQRGNLGWTSDDGIRVTISGAKFHACPMCNTAIFPQNVKDWLEKALDQKRAIGGSPYLFLNAFAFAHS